MRPTFGGNHLDSPFRGATDASLQSGATVYTDLYTGYDKLAAQQFVHATIVPISMRYLDAEMLSFEAALCHGVVPEVWTQLG
jgi:hypothetical protein